MILFGRLANGGNNKIGKRPGIGKIKVNWTTICKLESFLDRVKRLIFGIIRLYNKVFAYIGFVDIYKLTGTVVSSYFAFKGYVLTVKHIILRDLYP